MDLNTMLPIFIAAGGSLLFILAITMYYLSRRKETGDEDYERQLQELLNDDNAEIVETKPNLITKWNKYWANVLKGSGMARYQDENSKAGLEIFIAITVIALFISGVTKILLLGPILAIGLAGAGAMLAKTVANKQANKINELLPGFIFALKANIQAAETNERSMLKVVDSMPSPLYEDLIVVKQSLLASNTFTESLQELSAKTSSDDLKFLAACMIQAAESGANMEQQLDNIQEVLIKRKEVEDEINKAVNSSKPAIILASAILPLLFFFTYFQSPAARDFWFVEPISWIFFIVVIALYGLGIFFTKKQIDKIRDL